MRKSIFLLILNLSFLSITTAGASDTLKLNLQQADSLFLAHNFNLLAAAMNIEAQKAQVIQAKLYPNPLFTASINAYDPENKKAFHTGASGQKVFQMEQLILLGGKRKMEIEMAKTNALIAELEFQQLLRQLKCRLHSDLFIVGLQHALLDKYNEQLALIQTFLNDYQIQANKGNIPLKDVVRLKGAYLKLHNDRSDLLKQYFEAQANLQILLQTDASVGFHFSDKEVEEYIKPYNFEQLVSIALDHQPELLMARQDKILAGQEAHFQRRSAIPDISLFSSYDQRSGAFNNEVNAGIALPLPLWSRNQGNIKSALFKEKEAGFLLQARQQEVLSNLRNNYAYYVQMVSEYKEAARLYNDDFEITIKGMTDNFKKHNVSIIEFVDFFEAYNSAFTELTRIKTELVGAAESLNLLIGKDIL